MKEYINSANEYSELIKFVRGSDLNSLDTSKLLNIAQKISKDPYSLIIVEEYDSGDKSPFVIKKFHTYVVDSREGKIDHIGDGVCHYSSEVNTVTFMIPVLFLFILSFMIPIVSRFVGLISIPENCLDAMTYMIAPLAFIIGLVMPFITNILLGIVGFDLPPGNADLMQSLRIIIVLIALFRIAPMIGMVAFCIKSNLYTEYLREKWFLLIVTIGGSLGNMCWLILGMLMEMSYTGTMIMDSFMTASTNVVSTGIGAENFNLTSITDLVNKNNSENYFEEESNFQMLGDLSIFILNSSIFMLQSIQLSKYTSDIM